MTLREQVWLAIEEWRKERGYTELLTTAYGLGTTVHTLRRIRDGKARIRGITLKKMLEAGVRLPPEIVEKLKKDGTGWSL
jgi:hypothetical protein